MKCKNIEVTGTQDLQDNIQPVACYSWEHFTGTFKKRKQKIRKGPLQGHSPKEFKPRWGSLYEDDADDEDEPEQDDDLQGAQDGDAEDGKRGKTDRKPGKGRKSGRKGGAWGAW